MSNLSEIKFKVIAYDASFDYKAERAGFEYSTDSLNWS